MGTKLLPLSPGLFVQKWDRLIRFYVNGISIVNKKTKP